MTNMLTEDDFELLLRKVEKVYDAHITFAAHSQLYKEYLGEHHSQKAIELLHTVYKSRNRDLGV